jgi:16S rRNA (cytidine1402-2'-O)-methyltransferase
MRWGSREVSLSIRHPGKLSIVATPIGNLGDVSQRALDTLRSCDRIVAEDTRRTRQLLTHFGIAAKRVERLDDHARERDLARVVARLCAGEHVALVTDAGTPGVSDPGGALVDAAIRHSVPVVPIPGASAVVAAVVASGLAPGGRFRFVGFLPRAGGARHAAIACICETPEPVVLFESPHRTEKTLLELAAKSPDRPACVARELTKVHEEFVRGSLDQLARLGGESYVWRGEITIVLGANSGGSRTTRARASGSADAGSGVAEAVRNAALDEQIDAALARGERPRAIVERLSEASGLPKRKVYARILQRKGSAK